MPSESCLGTPWGPSYDQFCKTCVFAKVRKVGESDPLSSDPLSSDPLSSDPLSSDPISSDPPSSDIETILFQGWYKSGTNTVQKRYKSGTKMVQKR